MNSGEKLTIETPEQIPLEFPLAGIGSRGLALLFDSLVQFIAAFTVLLLFLMIAPDLSGFWPSAWNWAAALYILLLFSLYWGYFAFFETIWKGQTPGKKHAHIRVIHDSGRAITAYEAIARNLMRAIDSLPGAYSVGLIAMFVDARNRRLGDLVAGTVVVHERREESRKPVWNTVPASQVAADSEVAARLTVQELELIETFLGRRLELAPEVRRQTARTIADRIASKLNVTADARGSDEDFLESAARQYRNAARLLG